MYLVYSSPQNMGSKKDQRTASVEESKPAEVATASKRKRDESTSSENKDAPATNQSTEKPSLSKRALKRAKKLAAQYSAESHPALTYLDEWRANHQALKKQRKDSSIEVPAWKFQKVRQTYLLANFCDESKLSDEYFGLLLKYIRDLRGVARTQTLEDCDEVMSLHDRREYHRKEIFEFKLAKLREEQSAANAILNEETSTDANAADTRAPLSTVARSVTAAADAKKAADTDSSSSSSSDSDSDSDSSDSSDSDSDSDDEEEKKEEKKESTSTFPIICLFCSCINTHVFQFISPISLPQTSSA
jgi:hypothetical protein